MAAVIPGLLLARAAVWAVVGLGLAAGGLGQEKGDGGKAGGSGLVPIDLKLPRPAFKGTPKNIPPGTKLEKPRDKPREPFLAPPGSRIVSGGRPVTSSRSSAS